MAKSSGTTRYVGASTSTSAKSAAKEAYQKGGGKKPKIALNSITVNTTDYYSVMGHEPRGTGQYAFAIGNKDAFSDINKAFWATGSYTTALKAAKLEAQKRGQSRIWVMG